MVPDEKRSERLQQFLAARGGLRLFVLTAVSPMLSRQSRYLLIQREGGGTLLTCDDCGLRAPFEEGREDAVAPEPMAVFLEQMAIVGVETLDDYRPANIHDGVTVIVEYVDHDTYHRLRIIDPPPGSLHARVLAAWANAFPRVRRALR